MTEEFLAAMIVELIYDDYFGGVGKGLKLVHLLQYRGVYHVKHK